MKPTIDIFCGAPIEVESEKDFVGVLTADLAARNQFAVILANFFPPTSHRQIDFLVVTSECACHVELKKLTAPVVGGRNGPWKLRCPDNSTRSLDGANPYRQALDGKFGISDAMHAFSPLDPTVPPLPPGVKYFQRLTSVVCVYPDLLPGSSVYQDHKVAVCGYSGLLDILSAGDRNPGWKRDVWNRFAMHMQLVRLDDSNDRTPPEANAAREAIASYLQRFRAFYGGGLPTRVPTELRRSDGASCEERDLVAFASGRHLQLIGPSGCGKSLLAKHLVLAAIESGRVPVLVPAKEYDGRLSSLLDRSVAHLHPGTAAKLLAAADRIGSPIGLVVDGFNECAQRLQKATHQRFACVLPPASSASADNFAGVDSLGIAARG